MKKTLLILLTCFVSTIAYTQDYKDSDYYYYDGIESNSNMEVTAEQRNEIINIKKSIGKRHAAIGRDRSLRGYEKGQAHRKLNQQVRKEIKDVLNSGQRDSWDKERSSSSNSSSTVYAGSWKNRDRKYDSIEAQIDAIEDEIDDMEDYYEHLIDKVEDDRSLPKSERKAKKNELKREMKSKKHELKAKKEDLKRSRY